MYHWTYCVTSAYFFRQHSLTSSNWRNYTACTIRNNIIQLAVAAEPYIKPSSTLDWCITLCFLAWTEASILEVLTVTSTSKLCINASTLQLLLVYVSLNLLCNKCIFFFNNILSLVRTDTTTRHILLEITSYNLQW